MATFYEGTGTLVDEWNVDDVQQQRPDLNHEQACDVLEFISRKFDANIGINWDFIDWVAHDLFPQEQV
tara:strand:- start:986 stop:1189 length:204 start_codon:yes stop_codon:yes gene_type:complete